MEEGKDGHCGLTSYTVVLGPDSKLTIDSKIPCHIFVFLYVEDMQKSRWKTKILSLT